MIDEKETFEAESPRFSVSPVAYGLKLAETNGVPWLIILRGTQIRLYPAKVELGVGRKGLAETFCEIDLPQLTLDNSGYLSLIFSTDALKDGGTAHQIMQESLQYAVALGARLRETATRNDTQAARPHVHEGQDRDGRPLRAAGANQTQQRLRRAGAQLTPTPATRAPGA